VSATQSTALSAVFRRIANDAPATAPEVPASPATSRGPQLYGFAEPQAEIAGTEAGSPAAVDGDRPAANGIWAEPEPPPSVQPAAPVPDQPPVVIARLAGRSRAAPLASRPIRPSVMRPLPRPSASAATSPAPVPPPTPVLASVPPPAAPPVPAARRSAEPVRKAAASSAAPEADRVGRQPLPRNRRLYRRVRLPAEIEIDGVPCSLIDVSIGGFAVTGTAKIAANTVVPVTIRLTIDGIEVGTQLNARVVYATQARLGGRFSDLTASQTAFLRYIVTWRGESVGTVGTTTLLDAITGGPDRGAPPGSPDRFDGARERWWSGLIGKKLNPPR